MSTSRKTSALHIVPDSEKPDTSIFLEGDEEVEEVNTTSAFQEAALQVSYRFSTGVAPAIFFGGEVLKNAMTKVPQPYGTMMGFGMMNANVFSADIIRSLLTKERPLDYLRAYGNGNFWVGLTKATAKFVGAETIPLVIGYGAGSLLQWAAGDLSIANNKHLQNLMFVFSTAVMREPIIGAVSWGAYCVTESAIELIPYMNTPDLPLEKEPELHWLQYVAGFTGARPFEAVVIFEVMRQVLLVAGQEAVLHDPNVTALVVACYQFMRLWNYTAFTPHPVDSLVVKEKSNEPEDLYIPLIFEKNLAPVRVSPSVKAQASALAFTAVRAATVLAAGGFLLNWAMSSAVEDGDKETLNTAERLAYNAALVVGAEIVETAFDLAPRAISWVSTKISRCCASLFHRSESQNVIENPDDAYTKSLMTDIYKRTGV